MILLEYFIGVGNGSASSSVYFCIVQGVSILLLIT